MTDSTQKVEYRLLLWTFEEASASKGTLSFTPATPAPLSPCPMPHVVGSGQTPQIATRFGASWVAGLGKKEAPEVVASFPPCGGTAQRVTNAGQSTPRWETKSKTKEWLLANAPGLPLSPDSDDISEEGDLPEFFQELLIALTRMLQSVELKDEGWRFKNCYEWIDGTTPKYVRVLIEREVGSADVPLCGHRRQPNSAPGTLSNDDFVPLEDIRERGPPGPRQFSCIGTYQQPWYEDGRPVYPRWSTSSSPYSDMPTHWSEHSGSDPFQAEYPPRHGHPDWWPRLYPESTHRLWAPRVQNFKAPPPIPHPSYYQSDAQPSSHRPPSETLSSRSSLTREQRRRHVPAYERKDSDDSWKESDYVKVTSVKGQAQPSVDLSGAW